MRNSAIHVRTLSLAFLLYSSFSCVASGQTLPNFTASDQLGTQPNGSYHGGDIDSVGLGNGTLNLSFPFISYPQRGKLQLSFNIIYSNLPQHYGRVCNAPDPCEFDWSVYSPYPSDFTGTVFPKWAQAVSFMGTSIPFSYKIGTITYTDFYGNWFVQTADGSMHVVGNQGSVSWTPWSGNWRYQVSTGPFESLDATGWRVIGSETINSITPTPGTQTAIIDSEGRRYGSSTIEDTNGNLITNTGTALTDSLGRSIPFPPTSGSSSNTDTSGCVGPLPISKAILWSPPGYNGGTTPYKFCYATVSPNMDYVGGTYVGSTLVNLSIPGFTALQSIVLPNGQTWEFEYNDPDATQTFNGSPVTYGSLSKITLPSGGTITYTYESIAEHGITCQNGGRWVAARTVTDQMGAHTWNYNYQFGTTPFTVVTDPLGNDTVHTFGLSNGCTPIETQTQSYQGSHNSGTLIKTANTSYSYSTSRNTQSGYVNLVPTQISTTWPNGTGTLVNQINKSYDSGFSYIDYRGGSPNVGIYGKVVSASDYDYGSGAAGPLLRTTNTNYLFQSSSNYAQNNLINLATSVTVLNGSGTQMSQTTVAYDGSSLASSGVTTQHDSSPPNGTYRGNATSVSRWLNTGTLTCPGGGSGGSGSNIISNTTFFDTGMTQTASDPCSNSTTYAYSSTYAGAFATTVTNALNQSSYRAYDFNTGLLTSSTDLNNLTTSYTYDTMWRSYQINHPDGGQDTITHQETVLPYTATLTTKINSSQTKTQTSVFDVLGRVKQLQLTSDPQGTVYTDTTFDGLGRVATVSNPYRSGTDITTTTGTTTYGYDPLGRKTSETYPDNSVLTTAYCGPSTLVTDPTGRWRRSRTDGLGHLVEVDEPNAVGATVASTGCPGTGEPIWVTSYGYDAIGNLLSVLQNGSHSRTFTYNSLSRLLTSNNPEVGTITYTYNPDGPVLTKKDARSITTTYLYDALHRNTSVSYSNGDTTITTAYDQSACLSLTACQNLGHRTSVTDAAGSEAWSYQVDATNNRSIHVDRRTTNSSPNNITKTSTYYLDLAGNVTQAVYPTGRVVNYTYDTANRPSTANDGSNGITYAAGPDTSPGGTCLADVTCYTPQGTFYALSIGETASFTGLNLTHIYNSRLQPSEFKASSTGGNAIDISYSFVDPVSGKNAGHVYGSTNNLDSTRSQTFGYDQLNRITAAQTTSTFSTSPSHCWAETYNIDPWGNLQSLAGGNSQYTGCTYETGFTKTADANNHLSGFSYDTSGNTTADGFNSYTWDAESQLKVTAGSTYQYDGDGRRVAKANTAVPPVPYKLYWYGAGGEVLAETDATGNTTAEYIFFGGKRIAQVPASGNPIYYVEDLLGTSRVITTNTGVVCYDADFYPYGGERAPYTSTCSQNYKFEGKERDTETGNDDFGARYYSNRFGRWLSADWSAVPVAVPYANLTNPQTLNLYSMVSDDPESFADLDGHSQMGTPITGANIILNGVEARLNMMGQNVVSDPAAELAQYNQATADQAAKQAAAQQQDELPAAGEGSQANLDRRNAIAANAEEAAQQAALGQSSYGPNQCSTFLSDQITKAGAQAQFTPDDGPARAPVAGEWHNPKASIPQWRVLGASEKPLPGDVAAVRIENPHFAATGHSAIVVTGKDGHLSAVAAGDHGVKHDPKFMSNHSPTHYSGIVYRRYTGE